MLNALLNEAFLLFPFQTPSPIESHAVRSPPSRPPGVPAAAAATTTAAAAARAVRQGSEALPEAAYTADGAPAQQQQESHGERRRGGRSQTGAGRSACV